MFKLCFRAIPLESWDFPIVLASDCGSNAVAVCFPPGAARMGPSPPLGAPSPRWSLCPCPSSRTSSAPFCACPTGFRGCRAGSSALLAPKRELYQNPFLHTKGSALLMLLVGVLMKAGLECWQLSVCLSVCSVSQELHGPEGSSQQQQGWRSYGAARAPRRGASAQGQLPGAVLELVPRGLNLWGAPLAPQRERRGWVSCWGHSTRSTRSTSSSSSSSSSTSTNSSSTSTSPAFWRGPGSCPAVQVPEGCTVLVPWVPAAAGWVH